MTTKLTITNHGPEDIIIESTDIKVGQTIDFWVWDVHTVVVKKDLGVAMQEAREREALFGDPSKLLTE